MYRVNYVKDAKYLGIAVILLFSFLKLGTVTNTGGNGKELKQRVINALSEKFDYNNHLEISVETDGGIKISGAVNSLYDKYKVFEIVSRVSGVKRINDNLLVNTPLVPDNIIRTNIENELNRITAIRNPQNIKINVDNGEVILGGVVSFYREKLLAKTVASWQKGVKGLINNINVLPLSKALSDENLENVLKAMIKDEFPAYDNIKVSVSNDVATVSGSVNFLFDKNDIANEIASVIGIKSVKNRLTVNGING